MIKAITGMAAILLGLAILLPTRAGAAPNYKITVMPGGTEMEYSGNIEFGASSALRSALGDNPGVKVLHLFSRGGSVYWARQMQNLVRDHGLITVIDSRCMSACAFVFLAGTERYMAPGAQLGFHRESADGESAAEINMVQEADAQSMRAMGIPGAFIDKAFSTPSSDIWIPSIDELKSANVITGVTTRFAMPDDAKLAANLAEQVLTSNPYKILETSDAARFKTIGDKIRDALGKLAAVPDIPSLPSREVAPLIWNYWGLAGDGLALKFGRAFQSYFAKLSSKNPEECYLLFFPGRAASDFKPSEVLTGADFADFADVQARVIVDGAVHKTVVPAETDIKKARDDMWRIFKDRYHSLVSVLNDLGSADIDHGQACAAMAGMLDAVLTLPPSQGGPLLRYIFRPD